MAPGISIVLIVTFRCVLISLVFAAASRVRYRSSSSLTREGDGTISSGSAPNLGRYSKQYEVQEYLARGGQAEVWTGVELKTDRKVVFRFPFGLCDAGPARCFVSELGTDELEALRSSCALAVQANERARIRKQHIIRKKKQSLLLAYELGYGAEDEEVEHTFEVGEEDEFVECILPVSRQGADPAFEVWSVAGEVTLGEGFFMDSPLGVLTIGAKREVIKDLRDMIVTLSDSTLELGGACCCLTSSEVDECTSAATLNWFRKLGNFACPRGYTEKAEACGAITHHDVKFDNVMLSKSTSGDSELKATLIDFGAASKCNAGKAKTATRDWVPFWLDNPLMLDQTQCWNYDTYDVGMIWLITELLAELPATQFLCHAAIKAGLMGVNATNSRQLRSRASSCSDVVLRRAWKDPRIREDALIPIHLLVRSLRLHFTKMPILASVSDFANALEKFIHDFGESDEELRSIPLIIPPEEFLEDIFTMIQECPSFPKELKKDPRTEVTLQCRFRLASHNLRKAVATKDDELINSSVQHMRESCVSLQDHELEKAGPINYLAIEERCNNQGLQALWTMVVSCNDEGVQQLMRASDKGRAWSYVTSLLPDGETLLAVAARRQCAKVVSTLIEFGASPLHVEYTRSVDEAERSARAMSVDWKSRPLPAVLAAASISNNVDSLEFLLIACLEQGVSPESLSKLHVYSDGDAFFGPSLLSLVAATGDIDMLRLVLKKLLEGGASVVSNAVLGISHGDVPLAKAAEAGMADACRELLEVGANPAVTDSLQRTPLMLAVQAGHVDTVTVLGTASLAEVQKPARFLGFPLHLAAERDDVPMLKVLLGFGAKVVDRATAYRETALHTACRCGSFGAVELLAKVSEAHVVRNVFGETPLALAAYLCTETNLVKDDENLTTELPILHVLMQNAPEGVLQIANADGLTPLLITAAEGKLSCLRALAKQMPVDTPGPGGQTALMAAWSRSIDRGSRARVWRRCVGKGCRRNASFSLRQPSKEKIPLTWKG